MKKPRTPSPRSAANVPAEGPRAPTYDDLLAIVRLIESGSRFSEFRLRSGDIEVEVTRGNGRSDPGPSPSNVTPAQAAAPLDPGPSPSRAPGMTGAAAPGMTVELPSGVEIIRSPMVGTFYRAAEPGAAPFVEPGTRVERDTILCIIEVMKLMNSVTAGIKGVVTHVFVENAHMVEYGQPLIAIRPER
jgi:acetyl-CoA carboxylase biotin carboxyl carrier protein